LTTLCDRLWRDRHRLTPQLVTLDEALSDSRDLQEGPVILSEMSDAVGAGATGDSAVVLDACLRTGNNDSLLVQIVDPEVVAQARERGIGSVAHYAVGHKVVKIFSVCSFGPSLTTTKAVPPSSCSAHGVNGK